MRAALIAACLVTASGAVAAPTPPITVDALPMIGPSPTLADACEAYTRHREPGQDHALACEPPEDGEPAPATAGRGKPRLDATALVLSGYDFHCSMTIRTAAGVFLPAPTSTFGCGSIRSKSSWDVEPRSFSITELGGETVAISVTALAVTFNPADFGAPAPAEVTRSTGIVICRGGAQPACAVLTRTGRVTRADVVRDVAIRWPAPTSSVERVRRHAVDGPDGR